MEKQAFVSWSIDAETVFDEDGYECTGDDYALIEKVWVPSAERGMGVGRRLMAEAIEEIRAAHGGITIKLAALPFDGGMDVADLVEWYESFGFDVESTDGPAVIMSM